MTQPLKIIQPSYLADPKQILQGMASLEGLGFKVQGSKLQATHSPWLREQASLEDRLEELETAISDSEQHWAILCGKGGYGASDLLPLLAWSQFQRKPKKTLIGFSDISALLSAFWTQLGWPGVHAPMPGSPYWKNADQEDVQVLAKILANPYARIDNTIRASATEATQAQNTVIRAQLFGGCLSVLCALSPSPFFPQNAMDTILFFEDVNEHPEKVLRYWNQLLYSGHLKQASAVLIGRFTGLDAADEQALRVELARRTPVPSFFLDTLGHCSTNIPLGVGTPAKLDPAARLLSWSLETAPEKDAPCQ